MATTAELLRQQLEIDRKLREQRLARLAAAPVVVTEPKRRKRGPSGMVTG